MARTGTAPMIDERRFVPRTLDEGRKLYAALVGAGTSVSQARGILAWLIVLPDKRADDPSSDTMRRDYRRELLKLGEPPWAASRAKGAYLSSKRSQLAQRLHRGPGRHRPLRRLLAA